MAQISDNNAAQTSKVPLQALFLSLIWPGAGHFYAGRKKRGAFFIVFTFFVLLPIVYFTFFAEAQAFIYLLIPFPLFIFLYALLAVEAYGHANAHNELHTLLDPLSTKWPTVVVLAALYLSAVVIASDSFSRYATSHLALPFTVVSRSMEPRYTTDELYLLDKRDYRHASIKRGDVVVFKLTGVTGDDFVKRVVGLGGETVKIHEGGIFINGQPTVIAGAEGVDYLNEGPLAQPGMVLKIPEGNYFLLGDNSAHSIDSRYWGFVPRADIIGKVLPILRPWNKYGARLKNFIDSFAE